MLSVVCRRSTPSRKFSNRMLLLVPWRRWPADARCWIHTFVLLFPSLRHPCIRASVVRHVSSGEVPRLQIHYNGRLHCASCGPSCGFSRLRPNPFSLCRHPSQDAVHTLHCHCLLPTSHIIRTILSQYFGIRRRSYLARMGDITYSRVPVTEHCTSVGARERMICFMGRALQAGSRVGHIAILVPTRVANLPMD